MEAHTSFSSSNGFDGDPPFPPPGWTAELTTLPGASRIHNFGYACSIDDESSGGARPNDASSLMLALKAKHRASILWLLSKAFDNKIPLEIQDPYYRDHDGEDCLKPYIVRGLATGELYCLALSHIYQDNNYMNFSHHQIMLHLMRRGIYFQDPQDTSLTESVLIQDSPIKMSAHMVIIEAVMSLYIKEVLIPAKVVEVVNRFLPLDPDAEDLPEEPEDAAIYWINKCCQKFKERIEEELTQLTPRESPIRGINDGDSQLTVPSLPPIEYVWDLSDGCSIAALLSFYCPQDLSWKEICFNEPMTTADSIYNLQLIQMFCEEKMPTDIFFLGIEDFFDCHRVVRPNVLAFVADLLFHFEVAPIECVRQPVHHFNPLLETSEDEEQQIHQMNVRRAFKSSSRRQSVASTTNVHEPARHPGLSPAEMRAMSLQHTGWEDSDDSSRRTTRRQSNPQSKMTPSKPKMSWSRGKSQEEYEEMGDPELTKYFSALDIDASFDSPPEYVHVPTKRLTQQRLSQTQYNQPSPFQSSYHHHQEQPQNFQYMHLHQPTSTPKTATYSRGTSPTKPSQVSNLFSSPETSVHEPSIHQQHTIQRISSSSQTTSMSVTSSQQALNNLSGTNMTFNKRSFHEEHSLRDMDIVDSPTNIWNNSGHSNNHSKQLVEESDRHLEVVEFDPASLERHQQQLQDGESNGDISHKRGGWMMSPEFQQTHQKPPITPNPPTQSSPLPNGTKQQEKHETPSRGTFLFIPGDDPPVTKMPPRLSSHATTTHNNKLTVNLTKSSVLKKVHPEKTSDEVSPNGPLPHHQPPELLVIPSDPNKKETEDDLAKKKALKMQQALKRKEEQEAKRQEKQEELARKREQERRRSEEIERKKEEEKMRKQKILEEYRMKKAQEDDEQRNGSSSGFGSSSSRGNLRSQGNLGSRTSLNRSRPKSLHVSSASIRDFASLDPKPARVSKNSSTSNGNTSTDVVDRSAPTNIFSESIGNVTSTVLSRPTSSSLSRNVMSPSSGPLAGMPSMPPLYQRRGPPSDGASDVGSTFSEYNGPKLYVKPTQKSNRGIILNAINVVLAGTVNAETKKKVLEEIGKSDSKQFLILFRGEGLQFRALYSYNPDNDEAIKMHGVGPKNVNNEMIDRFFKYNSGTKNFTIVQTKHLSITIDGMTIHNHFWMSTLKRPMSMILPKE